MHMLRMRIPAIIMLTEIRVMKPETLSWIK